MLRKTVGALCLALTVAGCGGASVSKPEFVPGKVPFGTYRGTWSEFYRPSTRGGPITLVFSKDHGITGTSNIGNGVSPVVGTMQEDGEVEIVVYLEPGDDLVSVHRGTFQVSRDGTRLRGPLKDNVGDFLADVRYELKKVRD